MGRLLIAYFSRTGTTARLAEKISAKLGADLDRINCEYRYEGARGYFTGIAHSLMHLRVPIRCRLDPADYPLVVLGSPVWVGQLSLPMRSYLVENRGRFRKVAAFWVSGSGGRYQSIEGAIAELSGSNCLATASFGEKEVRLGNTDEKLMAFTAAVLKEARQDIEASANPGKFAR